MVSYRDQIAGELRGVAGGGKYTFDPDAIKQVIDNWVDLANSYARSAEDARPMTRVAPPGDEFVSESFSAKANVSGESYVSYCRHNAAICLREAQRYQDALDAYVGAEERTMIELGNTDGDPSTPLG